MSNAPYLLDRARSGYRMGHSKVLDHMFLDGLEDAYDKGRLMGTFAEDCALHNGFTREAQDAFAIASLTRAQEAISHGNFAAEIVPVQVTVGKEQKTILLPFAMAEPLGWLTPVFTAIVSYTFFGLDEIGDDLEDPFGFDENDLPCNALLRTLEREVLAALGETDLPLPLEPVEYVLT
jgi:acetyl-CoA C-acetyltransferase